LSSSYATARFEIKNLLEALQVFRFDSGQTESDWDRNKDTLAFADFLGNFVQENIAIIADNHTEVGKGFHRFIDLM